MSITSEKRAIELTEENDQIQTYTITLKKGLINSQKLQVAIEFLLICKPYHALKIIHTMGLNLMDSPELMEIDVKQKDALREVLALFTGLWEAEYNDHDPLDLTLM